MTEPVVRIRPAAPPAALSDSSRRVAAPAVVPATVICVIVLVPDNTSVPAFTVTVSFEMLPVAVRVPVPFLTRSPVPVMAPA